MAQLYMLGIIQGVEIIFHLYMCSVEVIMEDRWPGLLAESSTRLRGAYEVLPSGMYVERIAGLKGCPT